MKKNILGKKQVLKTFPFSVNEITLNFTPQPFYALECPDWVNVLAITSDSKAILLEQYRVGIDEYILETPGGVVDPGEEKDPLATAKRELEEETGYISACWQKMTSLCPNPAIQNNTLHLYLAKDCTLNTNRQHFPDPLENIEVKLVDIIELEDLVRFGRINHALSALCILLAKKLL